MTSEHLEFVLESVKPKTRVYAVHSKHDGSKLGKVCWHGPWRQYVFQPEGDTIYSSDCLIDIAAFLRIQMEKRKTA